MQLGEEKVEKGLGFRFHLVYHYELGLYYPQLTFKSSINSKSHYFICEYLPTTHNLLLGFRYFASLLNPKTLKRNKTEKPQLPNKTHEYLFSIVNCDVIIMV